MTLKVRRKVPLLWEKKIGIYSDIQNYAEKLEKKTCVSVFGCYLLLFGSTPNNFFHRRRLLA